MIQLNISNKTTYTLIAVFILIAASVAVYAFGTGEPTYVGHTADEIQGLSGSYTASIEDKFLDSSFEAINDEKIISMNGIDTGDTVEIFYSIHYNMGMYEDGTNVREATLYIDGNRINKSHSRARLNGDAGTAGTLELQGELVKSVVIKNLDPDTTHDFEIKGTGVFSHRYMKIRKL